MKPFDTPRTFITKFQNKVGLIGFSGYYFIVKEGNQMQYLWAMAAGVVIGLAGWGLETLISEHPTLAKIAGAIILLPCFMVIIKSMKESGK